jgi:predicted O-methyltransferase YrrM
MSLIARQTRLVARVARIVRDPAAAAERFLDRLDYKIEYSRPAPVYRPEPDWRPLLHELIGAAFPCEAAAEFRELWPRIAALVAAKGVRLGPESFYGYNDGDPAFVEAIWCLVRHLRPANIVETGVAHGLTTRFILEALERNGHGRLFSIDPPPEPRLAAEIAIAVDGFAPARWRLLAGTSRRMLPRLLASLGGIDLFVHDSLHTTRNVCFEAAQALRAMRPGGCLVIDDIDTNAGFLRLMRQRARDRFLVCEAEPVRPDRRRFNEKGLFGVMQLAV